MNALASEPRKKALKWLLKQLDMGVGRFPDAEVQAALLQEKIRFQRELREIEAEPKQTELFSVIPNHDEDAPQMVAEDRP